MVRDKREVRKSRIEKGGMENMRKAVFALVAIAIVMGAGVAFGADTVTLNLGHTGSTTHHYHTSAEKFAKLVKERTGGAVEIVIFPASQLGSHPEMTEATMLGTQDMVLTAVPILGNEIKEFEVLYMPYIFEGYDHINRFDGSEVARILAEKLEEKGAVLLGWWENGFRVITNNKRPIVKPEDVAGLKIRVGESRAAVDAFKLLGANPTPIAIDELYTALQLGTVDGQENPTSRVLESKYYEVQKFLSVTHHQHVLEPLIINKAKFESLPTDIQKALRDTGAEVALEDREFVISKEEAELTRLEELGMTINREVDRAAFKKALSPLYDKYAEERGEEWRKLVEMIWNL